MTQLEKYIIARWAYSIGKDFVTDKEYNILNKIILEQHPEYKNKVWSDDTCPTELLEKYNMKHLIVDNVVVSLDKSESIEAIVGDALTEGFLNSHREMLWHATYKADGFNIQVDYVNGKLLRIASRGRKTDAIEFPKLAGIVIPTEIKIKEPVKIIGELVVPNTLFLEMKENGSANFQRQAVSAAIADSRYTDKLLFLAFTIITNELSMYRTVDDIYSALNENKFSTPNVLHIGKLDIRTMKEISSKRNLAPYATDGVVIKSLSTSSSMIRAIRINDYDEPYFTASVIGIEATIRPVTGTIKVSISPVKTEYGVIRYLDVEHLSNVLDYGLYKADAKLVFELRSHSIPTVNWGLTKDINTYGGEI